jgi:hypothetical protein
VLTFVMQSSDYSLQACYQVASILEADAYKHTPGSKVSRVRQFVLAHLLVLSHVLCMYCDKLVSEYCACCHCY